MIDMIRSRIRILEDKRVDILLVLRGMKDSYGTLKLFRYVLSVFVLYP